MNFRFINILLLSTAPLLFAQEGFSVRQIESALEDGLYPLAELQATKALESEPSPEQQAELNILLIRSLAAQQRYDEALTVIQQSAGLPMQDGLNYWHGRVLFEAERYAGVAAVLDQIPADSSYAPDALRLKGRAAQITGDLHAAYRAYELFFRLFPDHPEAAQNMLDLADVYVERAQTPFAIQVLRTLLRSFPQGTVSDEARLELARLLIQAGGESSLKESTELLTTLGESKTTRPTVRVAAWTELAALKQNLEQTEDAATALKKAEELTSAAAEKSLQQAVRAALLIEEGKREEAFKLFDQALSVSLDAETSSSVLLFKAEALLKTQQYPAAEAAFQASLDITRDPTGQARALSGKGWSLWEQKRYEEAAVAFENAAEKSVNENSSVISLLKAGDSRLAAGQYDKAHTDYLRVTEKYPAHPEAPRAMYQSGIASLRANRIDEARMHFVETETDFPESAFASQAALRMAHVFKEEQQWSHALNEYRRITTRYTDPAVLATAYHQQGLTLYRIGQTAEALKAFQTVTEKYPDSPEAAQAYYMQGFCQYVQGNTDTALAICSSFSEKYPGSPWTPDVLFWMAEHYYNRGDYPKAHSLFLDVADRFPKHELADESLFWAGNSLLRSNSYLDAFGLYSRLAKEFPQSPLLLDARFAQGECLSELGEFSRAILAYEEVIKLGPDHTLADRARGRVADCLFTLGSSEPDRYPKALAAYQALYNRPGLPVALKLQVLYKIARTEEKLNNPAAAFTHYMEAVYSAAGQTDPLSPDAVLWFTRSVFDAAALQEKDQKWKEAVNIYQRLVDAGVPAKDEAQKRIETIRQEHPAAF